MYFHASGMFYFLRKGIFSGVRCNCMDRGGGALVVGWGVFLLDGVCIEGRGRVFYRRGEGGVFFHRKQ